MKTKLRLVFCFLGFVRFINLTLSSQDFAPGEEGSEEDESGFDTTEVIA